MILSILENEKEKKYGKLKVIDLYSGGKHIIAKCKCDCGAEKEVRLSSLKSGNTTSCGCSKRANLEGEKFGKLTVIKNVGVKNRSALWLCKCDCGKETIVPTRCLRSGNTKSCGCGMTDHTDKCLQDMEKGTRIGSLMRKEGKNNTSGKVGVYWYKNKGKWSAEIIFQKKRYFLGYYENFEDACKARETAEKHTHKDFLIWYGKKHPDKLKKIEEKTKIEP